MKTIIITLLFAVSMTAQAQFVEYTPNYSTIRPSTSYSIPNPFSSLDAEIERHHYQNQIVESEVINSCAVSTSTGNVYPIQVKTNLKRNGIIELICIGIKMNNKWISCESYLTDVEDIYRNAKTQSEKSAALEMMEVASYTFKYNNTLYLIPKPED
jgi:hypothetical protein